MNSTSQNERLPADWREEWARMLAKPLDQKKGHLVRGLVFSLGSELFAIPAAVAQEVARVPQTHRLPGRPAERVMLININGRVSVCASLQPFLEPLGAGVVEQNEHRRLVVLSHRGWTFGTIVDSVPGIESFDPETFQAPPRPEAPRAFVEALSEYRGQSVTWLDHERLFQSIKDSLR